MSGDLLTSAFVVGGFYDKLAEDKPAATLRNLQSSTSLKSVATGGVKGQTVDATEDKEVASIDGKAIEDVEKEQATVDADIKANGNVDYDGALAAQGANQSILGFLFVGAAFLMALFI